MDEPVEQPPPHEVCRRFLTADVLPGELILDVGCGYGELMTHLAGLGGKVVGIEVDRSLIGHCLKIGLEVREGSAEQVPFPAGEFDRVVCSVVLPYTDERRAVAEWARVIRPGGRIFATYHGVGYGLYYMFKETNYKRRAYGARMLANTYWYGVTGRKLPGFLGDTLCQRMKQLGSYYRASGLVLEREVIARRIAKSLFQGSDELQRLAEPSAQVVGAGTDGEVFGEAGDQP